MQRFTELVRLVVLVAAVGATMCLTAFAADSKYKKLNKDGTGNVLFSTTQINKGEEAKCTMKTSFGYDDSIYARAYFSAPLGQLTGEEVGFFDIWIDGKHAKRYEFSNKDVSAKNEQMQIYLRNTDPSPDVKDDVWGTLDAGTHKVKVVVGRTKFMRKGATASVQGDNVVVRRDDVYKPVYLSDSSFTLTK